MFKVTVVVENGQASASVTTGNERRACCICGYFLGEHNKFPTCGFCYKAAVDAGKPALDKKLKVETLEMDLDTPDTPEKADETPGCAEVDKNIAVDAEVDAAMDNTVKT